MGNSRKIMMGLICWNWMLERVSLILEYVYIYIYTHEVQVPSGATLFDVTLFHSFSLKLYNDKSTIGLHCLVIHSMLGKYQDDWKSITIAS